MNIEPALQYSKLGEIIKKAISIVVVLIDHNNIQSLIDIKNLSFR